MPDAKGRATEEKYRVLLDINNAIITHHDRDAVFDGISEALGSLVPFDRVNIMLYVAESDGFRPYTRSGPSVIPEGFRSRVLPREGSLLGRVIDEGRPVLQRFDRDDTADSKSPAESQVVREAFQREGFKVSVLVPMVTPRGPVGTLNLASRNADQYSESDMAFLMEAAGQVALAVENLLAYEEIARLKERLEEENTYLIQEIETAHDFEDLVGQSPTFRKVLQSVRTVADTDAGVLLLGETGTGKELIARAIHHLSGRKDKILVRVNCAALPANLIESEMFGHEKGAFTGATDRKIGRFEVADGGSLFLDEIGELPLELQSKLLRVLQEGTFERVGGSETVAVDVRIIAATNRDLGRAIGDGSFREDLYYRLNVFPIELPPLRERPEDIMPLVRHFVDYYNEKLGRDVTGISRATVKALERYSWPGNVRELENIVERAVIVSRGTQLELGDWFSREADSAVDHESALTLEDVEREHITNVLESTHWRIGGDRGAAKLLGLKRTTLQSRMERLGIRRPA